METDKYQLLKKMAVRGLYMAGSLFAYALARQGVNMIFSYLDLLYEHPTWKYTSLMLLVAWIIWVNVRKLSPSAKRLIFGCFFLGLSVLVGGWKIGCMVSTYAEYSDLLVCWGALSVLLASLLPVVCRQPCTRWVVPSKIGFWAAVLLLDFVVAMPNIKEDEQLFKCLYVHAAEKIYVMKTSYACTVLYGQDSLKSFYDDNTQYRSVCYRPADGSEHLWVSESGDSIYLTRGLNYCEVTRPSGESFKAWNGSPNILEWNATNCWQYNAWWKLKSVLNNKRDD